MRDKQTFHQEKTGFKIPPVYFANFSARLQEKWKFEQFSDEKFFSGFEVPENYFKDFSIKIPVKKQTKIIPLFSKRNFRHAIAIAAILAVMFSIFTDNPLQKNDFSTIEPGTIGTYLESHATEFSFLENIFLENRNLNEPELNNLDDELLLDYLTEPTSELSFVNY